MDEMKLTSDAQEAVPQDPAINGKLVLAPKDVRTLTGWSMPTVLALFNREDFPSFRMGKRWAVGLDAFREWINKAGGIDG